MDLDRKFCMSCQKSYPKEMIKLITSTGKTKQKRWKCLNCINKVSTQTYKKEEK